MIYLILSLLARIDCPHLQVLQDPLDDIGIVDQCNDAHRGAAVGALERIDFVHLLNQPGPIGLAPGIHGRFVDEDRRRRCLLLFGQPPGAARAVGIVAEIPHQMLVLVRGPGSGAATSVPA